MSVRFSVLWTAVFLFTNSKELSAQLLNNGGTFFETDGTWNIPDDGCPTRIQVPINVTGLASVISDVEVGISLISHPYVGDLDIYLRSPSGTVCMLSTDNGGSGNDYSGTVFDDEASYSISDVSNAEAPFDGYYRPEQTLSIFDGQSPTGVWYLEVCDDADPDVGTLYNWSLRIATGASNGTIDITVRNAGGGLWNNARCQLYDGSGLYDTDYTNLSGIASFPNITPGSNYWFKIANNGASPYTGYEEWGYTPTYTVTPGATTYSNFTRQYPYGMDTEFRLNNESGALLQDGSTVVEGSTIWMRVRVKNDFAGGMDCRVSTELDISLSPPYDVPNELSSIQSVPSGQTRDFVRTFYASTLGHHSFALMVESYLSAIGYVKTDGWNWTPTFNVISPPCVLEVTSALYIPNPVRLDQTLRVDVFLTNNGSGSCSNEEIEYYLSTDDIILDTDYYLGSSFISIGAGQNTSAFLTRALSTVGGLSPGSYYVGFRRPSTNNSWAITSQLLQVEAQPGSLTFTANRVNGSPEQGVRCRLYDRPIEQAGATILDEEVSDANGLVTFSGTAGTNRRIYMAFDGVSPYAGFEEWGNTSSFTLNPGVNSPMSLTRYMPYGGAVEFRHNDQNGQRIYSTDDVPVGSTVWMKLDVHSGYTGSSLQSRIHTQLDRDQSAPNDIVSSATAWAAVNAGNATPFVRTFQVNQAGIYSYALEVETQLWGLGNFKTDGWAWSQAFSVVQPNLAVTVPNGGEYWPVNSDQLIQWSLTNFPATSFDVVAGTDGTSWPWTIATGLSGTASNYTWYDVGPASTTWRVKVIAHYAGGTFEDVSDGTFVVFVSNCNLSVTGASYIPNPVERDQTLRVDVWTANNNGGPCNDEVLEYYLSIDHVITTSDHYLGTSLISMDAGGIGSAFIARDLSTVAGLQPGSYWVGFLKPNGTMWAYGNPMLQVTLPPQGSVQFTVLGIDNIAKPGVRCRLYDRPIEQVGATILDEEISDANGLVTLVGTAGANRRIYMAYDGLSPYPGFEEWGNTSSFTLSPGVNSPMSLTRYMPYGGAVEFRYNDQNGQQIYSTDDVPVGSTIWMKLDVHSGYTGGSLQSRVHTQLDRNQTAPYDIVSSATAWAAVSNASPTEFVRTFQVSEAGIYSYALEVETQLWDLGNFKTDGWAWSDAFEVIEGTPNYPHIQDGDFVLSAENYTLTWPNQQNEPQYYELRFTFVSSSSADHPASIQGDPLPHWMFCEAGYCYSINVGNEHLYHLTPELWQYFRCAGIYAITVIGDYGEFETDIQTLNIVYGRLTGDLVDTASEEPVLLLHGFSSNSKDTWIDNTQIDQFLHIDQQFAPIFLDYPNTADILVSAGLLKEAISYTKLLSGRNEVPIIAHSMGGLVSRAYLKNLALSLNFEVQQYDNDVSRLCMIATPNLGGLATPLFTWLFLPIGDARWQLLSEEQGGEFIPMLNAGQERLDVPVLTMVGSSNAWEQYCQCASKPCAADDADRLLLGNRLTSEVNDCVVSLPSALYSPNWNHDHDCRIGWACFYTGENHCSIVRIESSEDPRYNAIHSFLTSGQVPPSEFSATMRVHGIVQSDVFVPLSGATLTLLGGEGTYTTRSGIDGYYEFPFVLAGSYNLICDAVGYIGSSATVGPSLTEWQDFYLFRDNSFSGPRAPSVFINDDSPFTSSLVVQLNVQSEEASEVAIGTTSDLAGLPWQPLSSRSVIQFVLPDTNTTIVYAKFRTESHVESEVVADAISYRSSPATGSITVTSAPSGALIYWNGSSTGLVTPSAISNLPAGTHRVSVSLNDMIAIPVDHYIVLQEGGAGAAAFVLQGVQECTLSGQLPTTLEAGLCHVIGDISVPLGQTTTVMPGCTLVFDGYYSLRVNGTLQALGSASDSILFTTADQINGWGGIEFESANSASAMEYCMVEFAKGTGTFPTAASSGGIYCYGCSPTIAHCTVRNTIDAYAGGGICCREASPTISHCVVTNNHSEHGAGIYTYSNAAPVIDACLISANSADVRGGGVMNDANSAPVFRNCIILDNSAVVAGGGIDQHEIGGGTYQNCTIVRNTAPSGAGVRALTYSGYSYSIKNCVIAFSNGTGITFSLNTPNQFVTNSCVFGCTGPNLENAPAGVGVISTNNANGDYCDQYFNLLMDPLFVDTGSADFRLSDESPCIGAGDTVDIPNTDFDGNPRPNPAGTWPDIGAYENPLASPVRPVPEISQFQVNGGAAATALRTVTLVNSATSNPSEYIASEFDDFHDANWLPYESAPVFSLSEENGTKTVWLKVRNGYGQSEPTSDSIRYVAGDCSNAFELGAVNCPGDEVDVAISGTNAYIASYGGGLVVVDITDSGAPVQVAFLATTGPQEAIAVSGNHAYLSDGGGGLRIIDISVPSAPVIVGTFQPSSPYVTDTEVLGDYAYVVDRYFGVRVVDVSPPQSPQELDSWEATPCQVRGVAIANGYAYVAASTCGLYVLDISNPTNISQIGHCPLAGNAMGVAVSGSYAYVTAWDGGLRVVNVSNPALPIEVGSYLTSGDAYGVKVIWPHVYIADYRSGLRIVNVANPEAPCEVGYCDSPGEAFGVAIAEPFAYLADYRDSWELEGNSGMHIYSCSNAINFSVPAIVSLQINNGSESTTDPNVVLNIVESGNPTEYQASESLDFHDAVWLPFAQAATFTLSQCCGTRSVYVRVRGNGCESTAAIDSINLVPPPPQAIDDLVIQVAGNHEDIELHWSPANGASSYIVYADSVVDFAPSPVTMLGTTENTIFTDVGVISAHSGQFYVVTSSTSGAVPSDMDFVPRGTFAMGTTTWPYTQPLHTVNVPAFYMDRYEVTNGQYRSFCDAERSGVYPPDPGFSGMPNYVTNPVYSGYPVINVSWQDAKDYAAWVGKRLPTEAEWEFAARGTENLVYPWGNTWDGSRANISGGHPYPVDTLEIGASPFGCINMIGNVYEWCEDNYHSTYNGAPSDGSAWVDNPPGTERIIRGGAWNGYPFISESAFRNWISPTTSQDNMGFRCARTASNQVWDSQVSNTPNALWSVDFVDANHGWAVGVDGVICRTTDGGSHWTVQNPGGFTGLWGVDFFDINHGFAVGNPGNVILRTTNGGSTWTPVSIGGSSPLQGVAFVSQSEGWAVGENGRVLQTGDGGENWTDQVSGETTNDFQAVDFIDSNRGWAVGGASGAATIRHTTDGGQNWSLQSSPVGSWLASVDFIDQNHGWAVGMGGVVLKTTNGGSQWTDQDLGSSNLRSVHFSSVDQGWIVGEGNTLFRTLDGGDTWTAQDWDSTGNLYDVTFVGTSRGWAAGANGIIISTAANP